jgi:hypothetical protein
MNEPGLGRTVLELKTESASFFADLNKAEAKAKGLGGTFGAAGREAKAFGGHMGDAGKTAAGSMDGVSRSLGGVGKAIVAAFSVAAIAGAIKQYADFTGQLTDLSAKTGLSTTALQKLGYAAKMNGGDVETAASAASKLGRNLVEGDKSALAGLKSLGLSVEDLRKQGPDQMFFTVADAIAKIPDPLAQSALAVRLFGKSGADVLPMMKGNLSETAAEAERLGLVLDEKMVAAGDELGDTLDTLKLSGSVLIAQVLTPLVPVLTSVARWMGTLGSTVVPALQQGFSNLVGMGMSAVAWLYRTAAAAADLAAKIPGAKALGIGSQAADFRASAQWYEDAAKAQFRLTDATNKTTDATAKQKPVIVDLAKEQKKATGPVQELRDKIADLTTVWSAYEKLGTAGTAMRGEWIKENADAILKATRNAQALGVELPLAFQRAAEAVRRADLAGSIDEIGERAHAIDWTFGTKDIPKVKRQIEGLLTGIEDANKKINFAFNQPQFARTVLDALPQLKTGVEVTGDVIDWTFGKKAPADVGLLADAVGGVAQAFTQLAQVSDGSMGTVLAAVAKGVTSINLLLQAIDAIKAGEKAMAAAQNSSQKMAAGMQQAAGYLAILGVMYQAIKALSDWTDKANIARNETNRLVEAYVKQQGGLDTLRANLQLTGREWDAWAEHIRKSAGNTKEIQRSIEKVTAALDALKVRQAAAQSAVSLIGELIGIWVKPLRDASDGLAQAKKDYDELAKDADPDPLKLEAAKQKVDEWQAKVNQASADAKESIGSLSAYTVAAFAVMVQSTGDFYGALQSIGPVLDDYAEGLKILGIDAEGAIGELLGMRQVQTTFKGVLDPLSTATKIVQALSAAGLISQEAVNALATDTKKAYKAMVDGGTDAKVAMVLMQPSLQTLWQLWKDGKIVVDDETEAMLRQGEEWDLVGENHKSINEQMLAAFKDLKLAIEAMVVAIQDWGKAADDAFSRARGAAEAYGKAVPRGTPAVPGAPATPRPEPSPDDGEAYHHGGLVMHRGGLISPAHVGASIWAAGEAYTRAHTGLLVGRAARAADEVPILAQVGEGILSRDTGMPALGRWALAAMNHGQAPSGEPARESRVVNLNLQFDIRALDGADVKRVTVKEIVPYIRQIITDNIEHEGTRLTRTIKAKVNP